MQTVTIPDNFNGTEQEWFELLRRCNAHYIRPKEMDGTRVGPLVGYAGKDELGRQFVGHEYVDFAMAEEHGPVLERVARSLWATITYKYPGIFAHSDPPVVFCGAPEGGKAIATILATFGNYQYIYPEKKVIAVATAFSREQSELVFSRHKPRKGDNVVIIEDVCNNLSTTSELIELIVSHGARVVGIGCFLNRSLQHGDVYTTPEQGGSSFPVFSVVRRKIEQFEQDHPEVVNEVLAKNVIWKPKDNWEPLAKIMEQYSVSRVS